MKARLPASLDRIFAAGERDATTRQALVIAALIGAAVNLLAFGPGHLLGTSSVWDLPHNDARAYLMGYRYFVHEPWQWPPFTVREMNVPFPKSICFTDSIPLWAAINKAIATVIPAWGAFTARGAYLGLWYLVVYVLQACFGVAILREAGKRTFAQTVVTAVFFLALPEFCIRYGHASLDGQFVILSALYLYMRMPHDDAPPWRLELAFLGQLAAAAMINPYQAAMSFAVFVAATLKAKRWRHAALWLPAGALGLGLGAATAGFFSHEAKIPMGGFDQAQTNMMSPFIPRRSVLLGDLRSLVDVQSTDYQYEGYDYLGLGVLVLLVLFLPRIRAAGPTIKRHAFLFALVLGTWIFSLSNHVYFGSHRVLSWEFPAALHWAQEQFRAPGRFVWLPTYVGMAFLLNWAMERRSRAWQLGLLPLLAVLQVTDGALGEWLLLRTVTQERRPHSLDDLDLWQDLVFAHDAVRIEPVYDCIQDGTMLIDQVSQEIEFIASRRPLPINGVYSARPTRDCALEATARREIVLQPGTLYVLLPQAVTTVARLQSFGATCVEFRFGDICSTRTAALAAAAARGGYKPSRRPRTLALGERVFLGKGGDDALPTYSWLPPEENGRWSEGYVGRLVFDLDAEARAAPRTLHLEATLPLCGARTTGEIVVGVGGEYAGSLHFAADQNDLALLRSAAFRPPPEGPPLLVELWLKDIRTAAELGCGTEARPLGVMLRSVWVD